MSQTENPNAKTSVPAQNPTSTRVNEIYAALPDLVKPDMLSRKMGGKPTGLQIRRYLREVFETEGRQDWTFSKTAHREFLLQLIGKLLTGSVRSNPIDDSKVAKATAAMHRTAPSAGNSGR